MFIIPRWDPAKYEIIDTRDEIKSPGEWYSTPIESITTKHWQICSVWVTYKVKCSFIRGVHRREPPIYFGGLTSPSRRQTAGRRRSLLHSGRECMRACFRSFADARPSWGWCHSRAFSLPVPAGSPEKKPGAGEDAPHSPSRPVHAYLPLPGLPVGRAAVFVGAPHCCRVTGADPTGFLWTVVAASHQISGSLCCPALLQLVGNPELELLWVRAERRTQDPLRNWVTLMFPGARKWDLPPGHMLAPLDWRWLLQGWQTNAAASPQKRSPVWWPRSGGHLQIWPQFPMLVLVGLDVETPEPLGLECTGPLWELTEQECHRNLVQSTGPAVDSFCTGGRLAGRLQGSWRPEAGVVRALCTSSWSEPLALCIKLPQGSVSGAVKGSMPSPGFRYFLLLTSWTSEGKSCKALILLCPSLCLLLQCELMVASFLERYWHVPMGHSHSRTSGWCTSAQCPRNSRRVPENEQPDPGHSCFILLTGTAVLSSSSTYS